MKKLYFLAIFLIPSIAFGSVAPDKRISDNNGNVLAINSSGQFTASISGVSADAVIVGNTGGTSTVKPTLPDCQDSGGNHLNYTQSTKNFVCGSTNAPTTFSRIKVDSGNGTGSGSTKVRRYTNLTVSSGGAIVRATDSVSGDVFTIRAPGYYCASRLDYNTTGAVSFGISLNAQDRLASAFGSGLLTASQVLNGNTSTGANNFATAAWCGPLVSGDTVRAHEGGTASNATDALSNFDISQIGKS